AHLGGGVEAVRLGHPDHFEPGLLEGDDLVDALLEAPGVAECGGQLHGLPLWVVWFGASAGPAGSSGLVPLEQVSGDAPLVVAASGVGGGLSPLGTVGSLGGRLLDPL